MQAMSTVGVLGINMSVGGIGRYIFTGECAGRQIDMHTDK